MNKMDDKQYVLLSDILADIEYKINWLKLYLDENSDKLSEGEKSYFLGKIAGYASIQFSITNTKKYMLL